MGDTGRRTRHGVTAPLRQRHYRLRGRAPDVVAERPTRLESE